MDFLMNDTAETAVMLSGPSAISAATAKRRAAELGCGDPAAALVLARRCAPLRAHGAAFLLQLPPRAGEPNDSQLGGRGGRQHRGRARPD